MKVFLSWSGPVSEHIAKALRDWLPNVLQAAEPWLSSRDIESGKQWNLTLTNTLKDCTAGIVCLTGENLTAPWILFEAGALSKTVDAYVCTYLYNLNPADVEPPLSGFQAKEATEQGTLEVVQALNRAMGSAALQDQQLERAFEKWWPELEKELMAVPEASQSASPPRELRDLTEEILGLVRTLSRSNQNASSEVAAIPAPLAEQGISGSPIVWDRSEDVERRAGMATLRSPDRGEEKMVQYESVLQQDVKVVRSLEGGSPVLTRGKYHLTGTVLLGDAFELAHSDSLILRLEDGVELTIRFERLYSDRPSPFIATSMVSPT